MQETTYRFLNGVEIPRTGWPSRGLLMEQRPDLMPVHIEPVIQNTWMTVRQDAEFAVPGFYALGTRKQYRCMVDLPADQFEGFCHVLRAVREAMRDILKIERAHTYHEEKMREPHFHMWIVPMWPDVLAKHAIEPRVWEGNIRHYLELFKFEEEDKKILCFNRLMREALLTNSAIRKLGFE